MPGFASLFGRKHPPADPSKVAAAVSAAEAAPAASSDAPAASTVGGGRADADGGGGGCPVKREGATSSAWSVFRRSGPGPGSEGPSDAQPQRVQYDVYSRPVPLDPTNNMPLPNPQTAARNALPSPQQSISLPTERVTSTIPKGGTDGGTWTYPSPQMFYNALARKGKLEGGGGGAEEEGGGGSEGVEGDMESVVAIHNCMNEATWKRVVQWEEVLRTKKKKGGFDGTYGKKKDENDDDDLPGPALTKFCGRPSDLSPKAWIKYRLLGHPVPFDRHDWTVSRTDADGTATDVRYVIDYYHEDAAAREDEGSGLPRMDEGVGATGMLKSLLVDVRPAADGPREIWGRLVTMPLARRGCRSMLECLLYRGEGSGEKSAFDPLPLMPSESLKKGVKESEEVWEGIQRDVAKDKACASDAAEGKKAEDASAAAAAGGPEAVAQAVPEDVDVPEAEARSLAATYRDVLSSCAAAKEAVNTCSSEEECRRALVGMTVCAGKFLCPLQHSALQTSMQGLESVGGKGDEELAEAKVDAAYEVLGDCVAGRDGRARAARARWPDAFGEALGKS
ncbi:hypothetical protein ACHAWF_011529 [Thalassiosira exigua]